MMQCLNMKNGGEQHEKDNHFITRNVGIYFRKFDCVGNGK